MYRYPERLLMVMEPALSDCDLTFVKGIHDTVFLIDAPRPISLKIELQWFRFAFALGGFSANFQAELDDAPQGFRVCRCHQSKSSRAFSVQVSRNIDFPDPALHVLLNPFAHPLGVGRVAQQMQGFDEAAIFPCIEHHD